MRKGTFGDFEIELRSGHCMTDTQRGQDRNAIIRHIFSHFGLLETLDSALLGFALSPALTIGSALIAGEEIRTLLYKRFFVSEEMRKTSLPSRNLCISTLVSWLSTLPRHTGKCLTWILLLPRHPTWILHLPRRRRGSFTFLVTQEVNNVDNTYILVANVDSIVSSSHRNCTTWIFKHPRSSSWILKVPRHTEIS